MEYAADGQIAIQGDECLLSYSQWNLSRFPNWIKAKTLSSIMSCPEGHYKYKKILTDTQSILVLSRKQPALRQFVVVAPKQAFLPEKRSRRQRDRSHVVVVAEVGGNSG